jgi:hypothetical protein
MKRGMPLPTSIVLALLALTSAARGQEKAAPPSGQRILVCGHSFHAYVGRRLDALANAAGIRDQKIIDIQFLGGSSVTQHWDIAPDRDKVKKALGAGGVDVLTLSPNWIMPDPAIDKFADLSVQKNPKIRILVQESWPAFDGMEKGKGINKLSDRDTKSAAALRESIKPWNELLEKQVSDLNTKLGRPVLFVVPVGEAVISLREKVAAGQVPAIARQSELFNDLLGHGKEPIQKLATYCYFAAIYRTSPVGLSVLPASADEATRATERILQEVAWQAVSGNPLSGVTR